jgi:hypothetical protein
MLFFIKFVNPHVFIIKAFTTSPFLTLDFRLFFFFHRITRIETKIISPKKLYRFLKPFDIHIQLPFLIPELSIIHNNVPFCIIFIYIILIFYYHTDFL